MKSFLFLFLLSLRIPQSTFCQWRKNLRQLLSSIFVGVDSYQPRIKGVPGYDVSRLWVPSVWSVRTIIPSVLFLSPFPARLRSLARKLEKLVFQSWAGLACDFYASQGGKQEMSPVRSEDYTLTQTTLTWPGTTQCRRSREVKVSSKLVSQSVSQSWSEISGLPRDLQSELKINDLMAELSVKAVQLSMLAGQISQVVTI